MKVCFWMSDKPRERLLADAFLDGVRSLGDEGFARALLPAVEIADCDVAVMVGVKSRELFRAHWNAGIHIVYLDKGYTRHAAASPVKLWEYWRVAIDAHQPTASLKIARPHDRVDALGLEVKPWRPLTPKGHILIAGSSAKYHEFYGLHDPTRWSKKLIRGLRENGVTRHIIYRPKPSWRDAVPISGSRFSALPETIEEVLEGAHVLITHGSNACFEAILAGVPVLNLGEAAAGPIAEGYLRNIEDPFVPTDVQRADWLARLAYSQFTMREFATGEAWRVIRPQILGELR
jgi:hypothetical protein